jgi:hypothetical protein
MQSVKVDVVISWVSRVSDDDGLGDLLVKDLHRHTPGYYRDA